MNISFEIINFLIHLYQQQKSKNVAVHSCTSHISEELAIEAKVFKWSVRKQWFVSGSQSPSCLYSWLYCTRWCSVCVPFSWWQFLSTVTPSTLWLALPSRCQGFLSISLVSIFQNPDDHLWSPSCCVSQPHIQHSGCFPLYCLLLSQQLADMLLSLTAGSLTHYTQYTCYCVLTEMDKSE